MAANSYTLAIKSTLPQDISSLVIDTFPPDHGGIEPPIVGGAVGINQRTPAQVPVYTGGKQDFLTWTVDCALPEADMLKLGALYEWQQNRLLNKLDGDLAWTDEFIYLKPQATLTRAVVATLITADGQSYGYPVVNVVISAPEFFSIGSASDGTIWHRAVFQITEVRSA